MAPETPEEERARLARIRRTALAIDSQPLLLGAARRLRRRLPGDDRFGDPLSVGGTEPVALVAREVLPGSPDRPSVAHELGMGALQVWQALSESAGRGRGDEPVSILFTDTVGFSSWALRAGDVAAVELLREISRLHERAIREHRGTLVKHLGDGTMAVFRHPQPAVDAALDVLQHAEGVEVAGHSPRLRAGIHHGRPRRLGGDYLGVDVNIAARVVDAAKPQQLLVSDAAAELLGDDGLELGRAKRLKAAGAPRELRVRAVSRPAAG